MFGRVPFKASFTKKRGGSDGFKLDSAPLFKVTFLNNTCLNELIKILVINCHQ